MRTLLVDSDIVAYKIASISQVDIDWDGDGEIVTDTDGGMALSEVDRYMGDLMNTLSADKAIVCLSDDANWRTELNPEYKASRKGNRRPELLAYVKHHLATTYPSYKRPRLEADDIMGILATHPKLVPGEKIIVSEDKDMRTIPAKVYNPRRSELGILDISPLDADRFHMWQTICGDPTDDIKGARYVGEGSVWATEILVAERQDLWDIVLEAYDFARPRSTEDDAILNARMAHILRASDFSFKNKKIRLWNPLFLG
jgi:DNA polymerase-1